MPEEEKTPAPEAEVPATPAEETSAALAPEGEVPATPDESATPSAPEADPQG